MTKPVVTATTLVTEDGVPIDAIHLPGRKDLAIVIAHGFTLSWQRPNVWRIANRFNRMAGVLSFDFRGHGRSGGLSTLGDREIKDLDVVVRWACELGYQRVAVVGFSMGASIVLRYAGLVGRVDAAVSVSGPGVPTLCPRLLRTCEFAPARLLGTRKTRSKVGVVKPLLLSGLRVNPNGLSGFWLVGGSTLGDRPEA